MKKIVMLLLAFCLLALPASAWDLTFEGNGDIPDAYHYSTTRFSDITYLNGNAVQGTQGTSDNTPAVYTIEEPFDGCLSYTLKATTTQNVWYGLRLFNEEGSQIYEGNYIGKINSGNGIKRISWIENDAGTGVHVYENGVYKGSSSYTGPFESIHKVQILVSRQFDTCYGIIDDITTRSNQAVIGTDATCAYTEDYQYFTFGFVPAIDYTYSYKIYDPDNEIVQTGAVSTAFTSSYSIPVTSLSKAGMYTIRLYETSPEDVIYYLTSKSFEYILPSYASMAIDDTTVSPGEDLQVMCFNANGYSLEFDGPGSDDYQQTDISSDECIISFPIASDSVAGRGVVILRDPSGTKIDYEFIDIVGGVGGESSISFNQDAYIPSDDVEIWFTDLPTGCYVMVTEGQADGSDSITTTYSKSNTGIMHYSMTGPATNSLYVVAVYDGELLDSDSAKVAYGSDYAVSGAVYDALTVSPLSGAAVTIAGITDYTDEAGRYSLTVPAGAQTAVISKDGYNPQTTTINLLTLITTKNWYLVPEAATAGTATIYGAVCDYETGAAIANAIVSIEDNNGTSYQALSRTSTGYYIFEDLINGTTWTLKSSKTGYDNYINASVTAENATFVLIRMVPEGYGSPTQPEDADDSSSTTTTERPGRAAARSTLENWEETMPTVLALIPFVLLFKLLGA